MGKMRLTLFLPTLFHFAVLLAVVPVRLFFILALWRSR
jgi:hypothetical protein